MYIRGLYSQLLAILNNVAMDIIIEVFLQTFFFISVV